MSRAIPPLPRSPFIHLVDKASRALGAEMVREARARGHHQIRLAHNAVFATLHGEAGRTTDMAARAGITKQSMGEVVRELAELGILEVHPDPEDRRAKLVSYTDRGLEGAREGRQHLEDLEKSYVEQFGEDDYEAARRVLEGVIARFAAESPRAADRA